MFLGFKRLSDSDMKIYEIKKYKLDSLFLTCRRLRRSKSIFSNKSVIYQHIIFSGFACAFYANSMILNSK